jgi:hypothetical protein
MIADLTWPMVTLLALGAFHGINPAMGWLFAVALGLQEQRGSAVWKAMLPLAVGHALAVAVAIIIAVAVGLVIPMSFLKWIVAGLLVTMGIVQIVRHRHPRWGGMQIGARDLAIWSFLMASAHGAGLMVLPFLFGGGDTNAHAHHHSHGVEHAGVTEIGGHAEHAAVLFAGMNGEPMIGVIGTIVHTLGYLAVMGVVAIVVYEKVGLRLLRRAWINLDLVWAAALIATGLLTLIW